MKFKQESYKPKNEELIKLLELVAGQKIILINTEKEEVIEGSLKENIKMDSLIRFKNGDVGGIVKNIKMEGKKIYLQTQDAVYELKIK